MTHDAASLVDDGYSDFDSEEPTRPDALSEATMRQLVAADPEHVFERSRTAC